MTEQTSNEVPFNERYDLEDQREKHRLAEREFQMETTQVQYKQQRRLLRIEVYKYVSLAVIGVVAAVLLFHQWWLAVEGPSAKDTLNHDVRVQCIQEHGSWISVNDADKTCVFFGPKQ